MIPTPPSKLGPIPLARLAGGSLAAAAGVSFGLVLSRTIAETLYHSFGFLASWGGTALLTASTTTLALGLWKWLARQRELTPIQATLFLPLFLPLIYLFSAQVNLLLGSTLLVGGALLTAGSTMAPTVSSDLLSSQQKRQRGRILLAGLVVVTFGVYLATLGRTVGKADTFEFQVVAYKLGIAHPTGYPLYLLLGKLFSLFPVGSIAFRVNLLSAVCATGATLLVFRTLRSLLGEDLEMISLMGALAFAFSPTLWSQAVEAEVYALNSLFVAFALWALVKMTRGSVAVTRSWLPPLALALGLGLSNHLTTIILFPAVLLALLIVRPRMSCKRWLLTALLFLTGLGLYLYLPLRWPALHDGILMTWREFVDWVIGGRFRGALQLGAWMNDPTRYTIVGRLVLNQWGWPGVALATLGLLYLLWQRRRAALITVAIWLGYAFYALSYHVPDISVFLIPAHLIMAVWMGCGAGALTHGLKRFSTGWQAAAPAILALFALVPISLITQHAETIDRSSPNPLEAWGRQVLSLELDTGAAILADSEKIAPLYYLQQTEGIRPDLEIIVLPDEATYRTQLDARLAEGQTVYLARFLPHLEGIYHLQSVPGAGSTLIRVSPLALSTLPPLDAHLDASFGPNVTFLGYTTMGWDTAYPNPLRFTLYWTSQQPVGSVYQVWFRLINQDQELVWQSQGSHPAGNYYPTSSWQPGEIIPDAHEILPPPTLPPDRYQLELALLVPFGDAGLTPGDQETPWLEISQVTIQSPQTLPAPQETTRIWLPKNYSSTTRTSVITGLDRAHSARPGAEFPITLYLSGHESVDQPGRVELGWDDGPRAAVDLSGSATSLTLKAPLENGNHTLSLWSQEPMRCRWLGRPSTQCTLGQVTVQGAPLPAGSTNFEDLIALLSTDITDLTLQPGGTLELTLEWQALAPISEDYTLFLHVLDAADRIVGQVDSWPVQGTYPTSQWQVSRLVVDPHKITIAPDIAPGAYRLEIGWYLLRTMQRLKVLDSEGLAVDDRILLEGLVAPE